MPTASKPPLVNGEKLTRLGWEMWTETHDRPCCPVKGLLAARDLGVTADHPRYSRWKTPGRSPAHLTPPPLCSQHHTRCLQQGRASLGCGCRKEQQRRGRGRGTQKPHRLGRLAQCRSRRTSRPWGLPSPKASMPRRPQTKALCTSRLSPECCKPGFRQGLVSPGPEPEPREERADLAPSLLTAEPVTQPGGCRGRALGFWGQGQLKAGNMTSEAAQGSNCCLVSASVCRSTPPSSGLHPLQPQAAVLA